MARKQAGMSLAGSMARPEPQPDREIPYLPAEAWQASPPREKQAPSGVRQVARKDRLRAAGRGRQAADRL